MKVKVSTVTHEKGNGESVPIEVMLDIDEKRLAGYLGQRALRSKRKTWHGTVCSGGKTAQGLLQVR